MRHIKLIVSLLAVTFIAGFIVWHLMWMTETSEKYEKMKSSGEVSYIMKTEKIIKQVFKSKTEIARKTDKREIKSHQENQSQTKQAERHQRTTEKSESMTDKQETQISRLNTEMPVNEKNREIIDSSNTSKTDSEKSYRILNPDKSKSFSATRKNRTLAITPKNSLPEELEEEPDASYKIITPHPTSTAPY